MTDSLMWAHYLRDDEITFRPPEESDAEISLRWHESLLPLTSAHVLESIRESEKVPWGENPRVRLIAGTIATGEVVGSVLIERREEWVEAMTITPSRILPTAEQHKIARRMVRIVVPWLLDEVGVRSILTRVPDDHLHLGEELSNLGFQVTATYRQYCLRPDGYVDSNLYQLLNPAWVMPRAMEQIRA